VRSEGVGVASSVIMYIYRQLAMALLGPIKLGVKCKLESRLEFQWHMLTVKIFRCRAPELSTNVDCLY